MASKVQLCNYYYFSVFAVLTIFRELRRFCRNLLTRNVLIAFQPLRRS